MRIFIACVALLGIFATTAFGAAGGRECTKKHGENDICSCPYCDDNKTRTGKNYSKRTYVWYTCKNAKEPGECHNDKMVMTKWFDYFEDVGDTTCHDLYKREIYLTNACSGTEIPSHITYYDLIDESDPRRD